MLVVGIGMTFSGELGSYDKHRAVCEENGRMVRESWSYSLSSGHSDVLPLCTELKRGKMKERK